MIDLLTQDAVVTSTPGGSDKDVTLIIPVDDLLAPDMVPISCSIAGQVDAEVEQRLIRLFAADAQIVASEISANLRYGHADIVAAAGVNGEHSQTQAKGSEQTEFAADVSAALAVLRQQLMVMRDHDRFVSLQSGRWLGWFKRPPALKTFVTACDADLSLWAGALDALSRVRAGALRVVEHLGFEKEAQWTYMQSLKRSIRFCELLDQRLNGRLEQDADIDEAHHARLVAQVVQPTRANLDLMRTQMAINVTASLAQDARKKDLLELAQACETVLVDAYCLLGALHGIAEQAQYADNHVSALDRAGITWGTQPDYARQYALVANQLNQDMSQAAALMLARMDPLQASIERLARCERNYVERTCGNARLVTQQRDRAAAYLPEMMGADMVEQG